MSDEVLVKLFEHNNWANIQMIQACSALHDEQLDTEPHSATKGTIRQTLLHLVSSQRGYLALLTLLVEERLKHIEPLKFEELKQSAIASGEGLLALLKDETRFPTTRLQTTDGYHVEPWVVLLQIITTPPNTANRSTACSAPWAWIPLTRTAGVMASLQTH
jgi:uncharacterized damage-inducible protein DinB